MSDRTIFTMRARRGSLRALAEEARRYHVPPRTLAESILEEGLRMRRYPGIVFVDRGGGRDAVLAGHPRLSVWQVVLATRASRSRAAAARELSIDLPTLQRALAYAADHPDEVEEAIRANEDALARAERLYAPALTPRARRPRRAAAPR